MKLAIDSLVQVFCAKIALAWREDTSKGPGVLIRFRLANHRSIRDEQELSLIATEFNEGARLVSPPSTGGV
ncbi:hypothetical protein [Nonomuraea sp. B19D2]|uniref:hypothetical protein n=1 Tax=Nonomuraea sp. B19D2 TaxID=3159561 RepID=UPI0032DACA97